MKSKRIAAGLTLTSAVSLAGVLVVGASVEAQSQRPLPGNAIDASNQVGSGGINSPMPTYAFNAANLFVTGNVTGGRQFRGFSPVRDPSSLFAPMATSSLSGFRADSLSLSDVTAGRTNYQANPFFPASRTVANAGAISQGLTQPGSSIPLTQYINPNRATAGPAWPGVVLPYAESLGVAPMGAIPSALPTGTNPYAANPHSYLQRIDEPQGRALAQSPLFGPTALGRFTPSGADAAWFFPSLEPPLTAPQGAAASASAAGRRLEAYLRGDRDLISPLDLAPRISGDRGDVADSSVESLSSGGGVATVGSSTTHFGAPAETTLRGLAEAEPTAAASVLYAPVGRSVYEDFVGAVTWLRSAGDQAGGTPAPGAPPDVLQDFAAAAEQARTLIGQTVRSYAGHDDSTVNRYVIDAERFVRQGDFYRAAGMYSVAATLDRDNPLVHMGHGHALLFAGDYLGAVHHLTRGIRLFDDIAYFGIDLVEFISDPMVLDVRRADLERRLERQENYQLRFLLGYAEKYSGLEKFGLPNLRTAAEQARHAIEEGGLGPGQLLTAEVIVTFPDRLVLDESLLAPPPAAAGE
ncbi:MAG: hypothetical protein JSV19_07070 [Phycisphaerales bacterium]|nr:MAG: hypothetical protein JSV19_07070 [Phycisphaerales bacterium]